MAMAVARSLVDEAGLADHVTVSSAGTSDEHQGQGMDRRAAAALNRRGWPVPAHRARQIQPETLVPGDLVLAADRSNARALARLGLAADVRLLRTFDPGSAPGDDEIPDPWFDGPDAFDEALELIERASRGLVASLESDFARSGRHKR
jgi:protein-tyrosine phosphatase